MRIIFWAAIDNWKYLGSENKMTYLTAKEARAMATNHNDYEERRKQMMLDNWKVPVEEILDLVRCVASKGRFSAQLEIVGAEMLELKESGVSWHKVFNKMKKEMKKLGYKIWYDGCFDYYKFYIKW